MDDHLIFLKPVLKECIWGGSRLRTEWGYESDRKDRLGECWAVSCNAQADNVIAGGRYGGMYLSELWATKPELFGARPGEVFPLLVKIIDAKENLSIQVHPDDAFAKSHGLGTGKRECWYILDCPEGAELIVGSRAGSREEMHRLIEEGKWEQLLNYVPVRKGDFIRIEPGTLHAITAGVELLEVQQNSDVTFRFYDYDRLWNGKPRKLHLKEGLEVVRVPWRLDKEEVLHVEDRENEPVLLAATPDFRVWTVLTDGRVDWNVPNTAFQIGSVLEGSGAVDDIPVKKGMHFILPHGNQIRRIEGKLRINFATAV